MSVNIRVFKNFKNGDFQLAKGARTIELSQIDLIADGVANGDISFSLPSRKLETVVRQLNLLIFNLLVEQKAQKVAADSLQTEMTDRQNEISDLQGQYQQLREDVDKFGGK